MYIVVYLHWFLYSFHFYNKKVIQLHNLYGQLSFLRYTSFSLSFFLICSQGLTYIKIRQVEISTVVLLLPRWNKIGKIFLNEYCVYEYTTLFKKHSVQALGNYIFSSYKLHFFQTLDHCICHGQWLATLLIPILQNSYKYNKVTSGGGSPSPQFFKCLIDCLFHKRLRRWAWFCFYVLVEQRFLFGLEGPFLLLLYLGPQIESQQKKFVQDTY